MIRYQSENQPSLEGFDAFFHTELDRENRWVKLRIGCVFGQGYKTAEDLNAFSAQLKKIMVEAALRTEM